MDDQEKQKYNIEIRFYPNNHDGDSKEISYEEIIAYQIGNDVVAVVTKEGETFIYPLKNVEFIRHYPAAV